MKRKAIKYAASLIERADSLIIAAGAGMGVDSGLPDFRGTTGFWKAYPALARQGVDFAAIASPWAFRESPEQAWGFYGHRLALYRATVPHEGFAMLQALGDRMDRGARVYTSNVDGAFQRAGFSERAVTECHGSIHHLQCMNRRCTAQLWSADEFVPEVDVRTGRLMNEPPRCHVCGSLARPNIMMFGDGDWIGSRSRAQHRKLDTWMLRARRPVVIEIGAGTAIPSVRRFAEGVYGSVIRINPREHEVYDQDDVGLPMSALAGIRALMSALSLTTL